MFDFEKWQFVVGLACMIPFLLFLALWLSCKLAWHGIILKENEITALKAGDGTVKEIWSNTPGYFYDHTIDKMEPTHLPDPNDPKKWIPHPHYTPTNFLNRILQEQFGMFVGNWLWPFNNFMEMSLPPDALLSRTETGETQSLIKRISHTKHKRHVRSLRFKVQRPFYLPEIEMGKDRLPIDLITQGNFRLDRPRFVITVVGDRLYTQLESVIAGLVKDFVAPREYVSDDKKLEGFAQETKGPKSPFSQFMQKNNDTISESAGFVVDTGGLWIDEIAFEDEIQDAQNAMKLASLRGAATVATSEANLKAATNDAQAKAAPVEALVRAYGGNTAQANQHFISENLGSGGLKFLSMSGNGIGLNVTVDAEDDGSSPQKPRQPRDKKPNT